MRHEHYLFIVRYKELKEVLIALNLKSAPRNKITYKGGSISPSPDIDLCF